MKTIEFNVEDQQTDTLTPFDAEVAEIVGLRKRLDELKADPLIKEFLSAKETLTSLQNELSANVEAELHVPFDEPVEVDTSFGRICLSARAKSRTISDKQRVLQLFAKAGANPYDLLDIKLKHIDDYLTPEEREKVIVTEQTGRRTLTIK